MYEQHNILERESILDIGYSFSFLFPAIKVLNSLDHERNLSVKKGWSYTGPSYVYLLIVF